MCVIDLFVFFEFPCSICSRKYTTKGVLTCIGHEDIEKKFTSTLVCLHFYLFVGLL